MKNPKVVVCLVLSIISVMKGFAQDLPEQLALPVDSTGNVIYTKVEQVDGATKDELYDRAQQWLTKSFKFPHEVIQKDDKQNGVISLNAIITTTGELESKVEYTMSIFVKDNKYKVECDPQILRWYVSIPGQSGWSQYTIEQSYPAAEKVKGMKAHKKMVINATNKMHLTIKDMLVALDKTMKAPAEKVNNDW